MIADYEPFLDRMIHRYEGGYGWNAKDPGGPTKYGITCFDLAEHRGEAMNSMAAWAPKVQALTLDEAETIYRMKYASAINFDQLPAGMDCCMLDYGVNSGSQRPIHVARAICGLPAGSMDPQLRLALQTYPDPGAFVKKMCDERLSFMHSIRGGSAWNEFGNGWLARVTDLEQYCDGLIRKVQPTASPDLSRVVTPKAIHVPKTAGTATAGGTLGGAVAAHEAGFPLWAVAGIAAGIIAAGLVFETWQVRRTASLNAAVALPGA